MQMEQTEQTKMYDPRVDIKKCCHVNTGEDGENFVGVKADDSGAVVYFPIGYQLPEKDYDIRLEIRHLFRVLAEFTNKEEKVLSLKSIEAPQTFTFPIQAYLDVINYYLDHNGYYMETEVTYKTEVGGKADWPRIIKNQMPYVDIDGQSFVYLKQTVRASTPNANMLITEINKYCVQEAMQKLGWLFVDYVPNDKRYNFDLEELKVVKNKYIATLDYKILHTNILEDKRLFLAMKAMIKYLDEKTTDRSFYFGTDHFEHVWEKLIDKVFGEPNKEDYFPRTTWIERTGKSKIKHPLEPDSIMILNGKYYVLDAKYYRYGVTHNMDHLPNSSDINKQITYGDYVKNKEKLDNYHLFNAFIMPYNKANNEFGTSKNLANVAEAVPDWRKDNKEELDNYEKIQGIVLDVRHLMYNYESKHQKDKEELVKIIEEYVQAYKDGTLKEESIFKK